MSVNQIEAIKKAKAEQERHLQNKQEATIREYYQLEADIKELAPRINDLITVANEFVKLAPKLFGVLTSEWENKDGKGLFTDSFYHRFGFYVVTKRWWQKGEDPLDSTYIRGIGIENGGACGSYDLFVDGSGTVFLEEHGKHGQVRYSLKQAINNGFDVGLISHCMKRMLKEFKSFEDKFNNYVTEYTQPRNYVLFTEWTELKEDGTPDITIELFEDGEKIEGTCALPLGMEKWEDEQILSWVNSNYNTSFDTLIRG